MSYTDAQTVIANLQIQRQRYLDGLEANEGDINLDIFEDFYPDKAHFVFELLQNAEDTKATECHFTLTTDGIEFKHNGTRKFTAQDVKSITGINSSKKTQEKNEIGKFGVGFKSVFIYTLTPEIHSGEYSFTIRQLIMPDPVEARHDLGEWTLFRFPFNNPEKPPAESYAEIREGLEELSELTLLFLKNIESVNWKIEGRRNGELLRVQHSQFHIEVLREMNGEQSSSSHFLRFTRPVTTSDISSIEDRQLVSIAYPLKHIPKSTKRSKAVTSFNEKYKIIPAVPGRVSVFFPAEKENSGLRFHLHAPFVPTLDRSSIKEIKENEILYSDLALLAAESLHGIKDMDMLSRDFLNVLPYETDEIPHNYQVICESIIEEMNEHPLTPTFDGGHAPARQLLQAKRDLKELIQPEDLKFLLGNDGNRQGWAIGAREYSSIDKFLKRLDIKVWDVPHFFEKVSKKCSSFNEEEDEHQKFIEWLGEKDAFWLHNFYSLGYELLDNNIHPSFTIELDDACIVRTSTGDFAYGCQVYFPGSSISHEERLLRVDPEVLTKGIKPRQLTDAKLFLEKIGVEEVDEKVEIQNIIENGYYSHVFNGPPSEPCLEDIIPFLNFFESNQNHASMFKNIPIFKCSDGDWVRGCDIFIDEPFKKTGLKLFADRIGREVLGRSLSLEYFRKDIDNNLLINFCITLGAKTSIKYEEIRCHDNPESIYLHSAPGKLHYKNSINRDFTIKNFNDFFGNCPEDSAKTLWNFMIKIPEHILTATYRKNRSSIAHYAPSQLVDLLRNASWVPQQGEVPVKPENANRDLLPAGFSFDPSWQWIKSIEFGSELEAQKETKQKEETIVRDYLGLGEDSPIESLEIFKSLAKLSPEKRIEIEQSIKTAQQFELHGHEVANPELRNRRVKEEARGAQERLSVKRERSVTVRHQVVKQMAKEFLRQEYTNEEGDMMCQICKVPLPFKSLKDGLHYFEAVEFFPGLKKKPHENYLALCPNHAAMFIHANSVKEAIPKLFRGLYEKPLLGLMLAEHFKQIYFTERHKIDLLAILSIEQESNDTP